MDRDPLTINSHNLESPRFAIDEDVEQET